MSTLSDLVQEHGHAVEADIDWLHLLVNELQLLADLAFADIVLWVPTRAGGFVAVSHSRPSSAATLFYRDFVGQEIKPEWRGLVTATFETATIIGSAVGLAHLEKVSELAERQYGVAEGLTDRELVQRYPGSTAVPGRESRAEVAARVMPALLRIAATGSDRRVIVTTHGGVIRTVLLALNAPVERGIPITNGSVHSFRRIGESLELVEFDDPIELDSVVTGEEDFDEQNLLENREDEETHS